MLCRSLVTVFAAALIAECGPKNPAEGLTSLRRIEPVPRAWVGLEKPMAIAVDRRGRVLVLDNGARKVWVFDSLGHPEGAFGGFGQGPGEFAMGSNVIALADRTIVVDFVGRRVVSYDSLGRAIGTRTLTGLEDVTSGLGQSALIRANSARWSGPPITGRTGWPLLRVEGIAGDSQFEAGTRDRNGTPFRQHIANFVLTSGTSAGDAIWVAFLNDPRVLRYSLAIQKWDTIQRDIGFPWMPVPVDLEIRTAPGPKDALPFDFVSLALSSDSAGNAYVLTALSSSRNSRRAPSWLALDRIDRWTGEVSREAVPQSATSLAVAPNGRRVYLLNERSGEIEIYDR